MPAGGSSAEKWFAGELDRLIERAKTEWEMSYPQAIGLLFVAAQLLAAEALEDETEDEDAN